MKKFLLCFLSIIKYLAVFLKLVGTLLSLYAFVMIIIKIVSKTDTSNQMDKYIIYFIIAIITISLGFLIGNFAENTYDKIKKDIKKYYPCKRKVIAKQNNKYNNQSNKTQYNYFNEKNILVNDEQNRLFQEQHNRFVDEQNRLFQEQHNRFVEEQNNTFNEQQRNFDDNFRRDMDNFNDMSQNSFDQQQQDSNNFNDFNNFNSF